MPFYNFLAQSTGSNDHVATYESQAAAIAGPLWRDRLNGQRRPDALHERRRAHCV